MPKLSLTISTQQAKALGSNVVSEMKTIARFASVMLDDHLPVDIVYATLAFNEGWIRHLVHSSWTSITSMSVEEQAAIAAENLDAPNHAIAINAWIRGYTCRQSFIDNGLSSILRRAKGK